MVVQLLSSCAKAVPVLVHGLHNRLRLEATHNLR